MKNIFSLNNVIKILVIALLAIPLIFVGSMVALFVYGKLDNRPYVNAYTPAISSGPTGAYSAPASATPKLDPVTVQPTSLSGVQSTYLPGVRRRVKAYNGPLDANGMVLTSTAGWWLYAYSDEEAAWLDKHAYPTPAEDQWLRSSSQQELKQLMELGDKNARAWLAAKAMKNKFSGTPEKNTGFDANMEIKELELANPYQSIIIAETYMDLRAAYLEKPVNQRTEQETKTLGSLSQVAEYAWLIANLLGDTAIEAISKHGKWGEFALTNGNHTRSPLKADVFIPIIFSMQQKRSQAGMPPLDFEKRPTPLYSKNLVKPTQVFERY